MLAFLAAVLRSDYALSIAGTLAVSAGAALPGLLFRVASL